VTGSGPPLLIISGPVGAGKTTVGQAVHELLASRRVPNTFVDLDALTNTWPAPAEDHFNLTLACACLGAMWRHACAARSRNLIVAQVVEHTAARDAIARAVDARSVAVVALRASPANLRARVAERGRDTGVALEWHLARAEELHAQFARDDPADVAVETDGRSIEAVAVECAGLMSWS
jgi:ribose 1,5-bisphosphokinase PhnN